MTDSELLWTLAIYAIGMVTGALLMFMWRKMQ